MTHSYTQEQINSLFSLWETGEYTRRQLAYKLNMSLSFVYRSIQKAGYKLPTMSDSTRKYSVEDNFFNTIDTEEKAYFLGLLYSDGSNIEKRNIIQLTLQKKDLHILKRLTSLIQPDKPIYETKDKKYCSIAIYSLQMSQDLIKLGCVSKKSLILKFPNSEQIPDHLMNHFIRGIFDGDGSIMVSQEKYKFTFSVCGTEDIVSNIRDRLIGECNVNKVTTGTKIIASTQNILYSICYNGRVNCLKIKNYLYKDATVYLNRKYDKFFSVPLIGRKKNGRKKEV